MTSLSAGSRRRARTSASQEKDPDSKESERLFGGKCTDSFAKLSPDGSWLKTSQGFSQVMMDGSLETFSGTWPWQGTMRNGECYLRPEWERRTLDDESLLWPTPNVPNGGRSPKGGMTRTGMTPDGKKRQVGLENAVKMWPTPHANCSTGAGEKGDGGLNLQTAVKYATPQSRDYRTGESHRWESKERTRNLNDQIGGQLNADWVELLMGFPLGHTIVGDGNAESRGSRKDKKTECKD